MNSFDFNFTKTKLIVDLCNYISDKRENLIKDLVAYTEDPVRYRRRIRMLRQLAQYEASILQKIEEFNTADNTDIYSPETFSHFRQEIDIVTSLNA